MKETRVASRVQNGLAFRIIDYGRFSGSIDNWLTQGVQKQLPDRIRDWRAVCRDIAGTTVVDDRGGGGVPRDSKHRPTMHRIASIRGSETLVSDSYRD